MNLIFFNNKCIYKYYIEIKKKIRIDKLLSNIIINFSRKKIQKFIYSKYITINKFNVKKKKKINNRDNIFILLKNISNMLNIKKKKIKINILFENSNFIILNKSKNIIVHPGHGNINNTLVNALIYHYNYKFPNICYNNYRPGIVHRIDKGTTGLLTIAKNIYTLIHFINQFKYHKVNRYYIGIVWGKIRINNGIIKNFLYKKNNKIYVTNININNSKYAITYYEVIKKFNYFSLIKFKLFTGRTHQIRVHMNYIGHPIFNDDIYNNNNKHYNNIYNKISNVVKFNKFINFCKFILKRPALHAMSISIREYKNNQLYEFNICLPYDIFKVLNMFRNII